MAARVSRRSAKDRERSGAGSIVVLLLLICGAIAFGFVGKRSPPADPYLAKARQIVERYERGRPAEARDYADAIYSRALEELARVDPTSDSVLEAAAFEREIRGRAEAQRARLRARAEDLAGRQSRRQMRDERFFDLQRLARPDRAVDRAACEGEGNGRSAAPAEEPFDLEPPTGKPFGMDPAEDAPAESEPEDAAPAGTAPAEETPAEAEPATGAPTDAEPPEARPSHEAPSRAEPAGLARSERARSEGRRREADPD